MSPFALLSCLSGNILSASVYRLPPPEQSVNFFDHTLNWCRYFHQGSLAECMTRTLGCTKFGGWPAIDSARSESFRARLKLLGPAIVWLRSAQAVQSNTRDRVASGSVEALI